jgi:hypothetical protein
LPSHFQQILPRHEYQDPLLGEHHPDVRQYRADLSNVLF